MASRRVMQQSLPFHIVARNRDGSRLTRPPGVGTMYADHFESEFNALGLQKKIALTPSVSIVGECPTGNFMPVSFDLLLCVAVASNLPELENKARASCVLENIGPVKTVFFDLDHGVNSHESYNSLQMKSKGKKLLRSLAREISSKNIASRSSAPKTMILLSGYSREIESHFLCIEDPSCISFREFCSRHKSDTKGRKTSIRPQLSLLMSNLASISSETIVLDPFGGSRSLLAGAQYGGAHCMDSDIDLIEGQSLRCDVFSLAWRRTTWCDAIITDPPYGLREKRNTGEVTVGSRCHIRDFTPTELLERVSEMLAPVFNLAYDILDPRDGRLVYLLPVFLCQKDMGIWDHPIKKHLLPSHEGLEFVSISRQRCRSNTMARMIIVMKKK
eukprot:UC4_evm1s1300